MRRSRVVSAIISLAAGVLLLTLVKWGVSRASASITSGSEVIQLVNQLRRANGLPPYQVNQALMAAAQAHSEYQAAQGSVTHNGEGGSRPRDRAVANGYGGGSAVSVSENIAGGLDFSASEAVSWWQGDNVHLTTMLSPIYKDVGAGVAVAGDTIYYTLDVGYVSGEAPPAASEAPKPAQGTPGATAVAAAPIAVATPRPDGAVVHVVEQGQVLWNIATAYKVNLAEIMGLNSLTEGSVIFPGDKLLIKPAEATQAITATQMISATATVIPPSHTPRLTRTPGSKTSTPNAAVLAGEGDGPASQEVQEPAVQSETRFKADPLLILIAVLVVVGTGLVLAGNVMKHNTKTTTQPPEA